MKPILWEHFEDCTACGACKQVCKKQAIELKENEYGFLFPYINEDLCVECGLCEKICPVKKTTNEALEKIRLYALRHRSNFIREKSSSGGAFTVVMEAVKPNVVFGAAYDADLKVRHIGAESDEDIERLRGSKYVQSNTGDTFAQTEKCLMDGKTVLYVGTPCQIAGLKAYLRKDYSTLFTCDLVCEGVQSQHFFDRYLEYMEKKYGKAVSVEFRNKERLGWERSDFQILFSNGKKYRQISQTKDSAYMNSFLFQGGCRDSCYVCPFAKIPRQGDFTLADLWGWEDIVPDWNDNKGISLLVCNTEKACSYIDKLNKIAEIQEITLQQAKNKNPNLCKPTHKPDIRTAYMEDLKNLSFEELAKKWLRPRSFFRKKVSKWLFVLKLKFKR